MEDTHIGFMASALRVLEESGEPLHYREITHRALGKGWIVTKGATPEATMSARIGTQIKREGEKSVLIRTAPGVFGLRRWLADGSLDQSPLELKPGRSFVPHYPTYEQARAVLAAWEGAPRAAITGMRSAIMSLTGTPEERVAWTDPDSWIEERLTGEAREWARRTWQGSDRTVNPRHTVGHWSLVTSYLSEEVGGQLRLSDAGRGFLDEPDGAVVRRIDESEGLLKILSLIAESGSPRMAELMEPWTEYLDEQSKVRKATTARSYLASRIRNLEARGLIERVGHSLVISEAGMEYHEKASGDSTGTEPDSGKLLQKYLADQRKHVREALREFLADIDPYAFEHVIKRLLEEIGYVDVETTAKSNDKGVDVFGTINVGITTVQEVVQVKRYRGNIGRPVLDALRGSLHRFKAMRGTIITTGGFSKGTRDATFEIGAAPITLIDGEKLIDLLIENGIGVRKRKVDLWELDLNAFAVLEDDEGAG
jgi:restriction system protein